MIFNKKIFFTLSFWFCVISCDGQKAKNKNCTVDDAIHTINSLSEVKKQSKYVDSLSQNKKHLSFMTDSLEISHHQYYRIKTGFDGEYHWETYTIFYVNKNDCSQVMVDEVILGDIITLEKWRTLNKKNNKMNNTDNLANHTNFTELFDESANIKFTPKDLNTNVIEIQNFKAKLLSFESSNPEPKDFNIEDLSLLVNNVTFSNNERFIDGSWLSYFINKYHFKQNIIDKLMDTAIKQEDLSAVKILSKYYIFSQKQIDEAKSKKDYKDSLHGKLDTEEYYDPAYSKIDEILFFIKNSYSKNQINDPDGFTNLRKDKTTTSEVLQQIKSGEQIQVLDNSGDWFLVKTNEGKEGYVHKSRVKSN